MTGRLVAKQALFTSLTSGYGRLELNLFTLLLAAYERIPVSRSKMLAIGASTHLRACCPSGSHGYARESAMAGWASGRTHLSRFVGVSLTDSPALSPAKLPRSISACPNRRVGGCGHSLSDAYLLHVAWIGRAPWESSSRSSYSSATNCFLPFHDVRPVANLDSRACTNMMLTTQEVITWATVIFVGFSI